MPRVLESPSPPSTGSPRDKHTQNAAQAEATPSRVPEGFPPSLPDLSLLTSHLVKVFLQTLSAGSGISQVCLSTRDPVAEAIPAWICPGNAWSYQSTGFLQLWDAEGGQKEDLWYLWRYLLAEQAALCLAGCLERCQGAAPHGFPAGLPAPRGSQGS